jgi:hypothetical protein
MSPPHHAQVVQSTAEIIPLFGLTEAECGIALAAGHRLVGQGRAIRVDAYQDRVGARYVSLVGGGGYHYTVLRDRGVCRLLGSGGHSVASDQRFETVVGALEQIAGTA